MIGGIIVYALFFLFVLLFIYLYGRRLLVVVPMIAFAVVLYLVIWKGGPKAPSIAFYTLAVLLVLYNIVTKIMSIRDDRDRTIILFKSTALAVTAASIHPHIIPWWAVIVVGVLDVPTMLVMILWQNLRGDRATAVT